VSATLPRAGEFHRPLAAAEPSDADWVRQERFSYEW
jgi:hypothetical protein